MSDIGTLEMEFVLRGQQVEAQMEAIRREVANDIAILDKQMKKMGNFDNLPKSAKQAGAAINSLQGQTANMAAQFQDMAVQLQGGGSPFTIALQQGTQLGAILSGAGGLGAAAKGVGAAFLSMLSPVNLVTIGLIAAGGAAVQYFMGKDEANAMSEALKKQPEIINAIKAAWGDAAKGIEGYSAESRNVVRAMTEDQAKIYREGIASAVKSAAEDLQNGLNELRVDVSGLAMPELANLGEQSDVKGITALKNALAELTSSGDILKFRDILGALATSADVSDDVKELANSLLASTKEAGEAARALQSLTHAETQLSVAMRKLTEASQSYSDGMKALDGILGSHILQMDRIDEAYAKVAKGASDYREAILGLRQAEIARSKVMDPGSFGPGDLGYGPGTNLGDPRLSGDQMRGLADRWRNREDRVFSETGMFSASQFSAASGILDLIAQAEGTKNRRGYNETLDYGRWTGGNRNLTMMTLDEIDALQTRMLANPENRALYGNGRGSSAVGLYQTTRETLRDFRSQLGLKGTDFFTPELQDRIAQEIVRQTGGDVSKLQGRWEGLKRVDSSVISTAMGNSALTMPGKDPGLAQRATAYDDLVKRAKAYIAEQGTEAESVAMTAQAAAKLKYEQQMLNDATRVGIQLSPQQRKEIASLAEGMAEADVALKTLAQHEQDVANAEMFLAESATDGLMDIVFNGKSASDVMAELAKSIAAAALQATLLGQGPLAGVFGMSSKTGGLGGIFGALFGGLGKSSGGSFFGSGAAAAFGLYDQGGFTGPGGKYDPAGIVHRGEYVFDAEAVRAAGGPAVLDAMRKGLRGYANGGFVPTSLPSPAVFLGRSSAPSITYAPVIDNRGADAAAVARLERTMKQNQKDFAKNVLGVSKAANTRRTVS